MEHIRSYYRLCAIVTIDARDNPAVSMLSKRTTVALFSKKQTDTYLVDTDDFRTVREAVVGAKEPSFNILDEIEPDNKIMIF